MVVDVRILAYSEPEATLAYSYPCQAVKPQAVIYPQG